VRGRVTERLTGAAVAGGWVLLVTEQRFGIAESTTNDTGGYEVVAPQPGRYRLQFERPGFRLLVTPLFTVQAHETMDFALQVDTLPPFALDTAVVEGQMVPRRLRDFYQRRARGFGAFLTRQEFERWHPSEVTDIVRRAPVFVVEANPLFGISSDTRRFKILSRRGAQEPIGPVGGECPPLIYVDDALLGNARDVNVDDVLFPDAIDALEFYEGGTQVPVEFQSNGSSCGVIAVWSRVEATQRAGLPHQVELGFQLGGRLAGSGLQEGRVGAQAIVGLAGVFEFYPAFNVFVPAWAGSEVPGETGWQVLVSLRARPLGLRSPWYVAAGITTISLRDASAGDPLFQARSSNDYAVLLTGVRLPVRGLHPLIELQVIDPTHPARGQVHVYTGATIRLW
jgi:hypothetical protein